MDVTHSRLMVTHAAALCEPSPQPELSVPPLALPMWGSTAVVLLALQLWFVFC